LVVGAGLLLGLSASSAVARRQAGPVNTSPPTVTISGATATANPGTWTGTGTISYAYSWLQCAGGGTGCSLITNPDGSPVVGPVLHILAGTKAIRAVVTATDADGSTVATSGYVEVSSTAPPPSPPGSPPARRGKAPKIALVSPRAGSIVHTQRFPIVLRVTDPEGARIRVEIQLPRPVTLSGPPGVFRTTGLAQVSGRIRLGVRASDGVHLTIRSFVLTVEPPVSAVQELGGGGVLVAPGCRTCVIRDPRGDDHGGPPDIESASSTYAQGWLISTIVTYDTVSAARHPCIEADVPPGYGRKSGGFSVGCFSGPQGPKVQAGGCDVNYGCGPVRLSFPNAHTTTIRYRPAQLGNPVAFYWDAWVLYPGDQLKDSAPSNPGLPTPRSRFAYCEVKEQLRPQPASAYGWGKNRCSQKLVSSAK
jgi:hypothetical protein